MPRIRPQPLRLTPFLALIATLITWSTLAELPLARLTSIYPPGGQTGHTVEVTLAGQDLDGITQLHFATPKITARLKKPPTTAPTEPVRFDVSIAPEATAGLYDLRAIGTYGITNPRAFAVVTTPVLNTGPANITPQTAASLPMGQTLFVANSGTRQFFRLALPKDRTVRLDAPATSLDSKMQPTWTLYDPTGHESEHCLDGRAKSFTPKLDGQYLLDVHDVLYRGGPEYCFGLSLNAAVIEQRPTTAEPAAAAFVDESFSLRRHLSNDSAPHDTPTTARAIDPPCEVDGTFRYPHYRDWYRFDAAAGSTLHVEVMSEHRGEPTAPSVLLQRADAQGKLTDVTTIPEIPAGSVPEFSAATRDPAFRVEIKEAGSYRLMVRNLFGSPAESNAGWPYTLIVRRASPDFSLVVVPASPLPDPPDSRDVPVWSTLIRKGGAAPVRVAVVRRDGFNGDIRFQVDGLPEGVSASESVIPAGSSTVEFLLIARDDAAGGAGPIRVSGSALIDGRLVGHEARSGVVVDRIYDAASKAISVQSRRSDEFVIAVSGVERAPLTIAPATTQATVGAKLSIPLAMTRRAEFTTPVTLKIVGHPLFAAVPPQAIDTKSTSASLAVDLAALKVPAGKYLLHAEGQGKLKYAGADGKAAVRELTASFYSSPFTVRVVPPPTTQPATQPVKK